MARYAAITLYIDEGLRPANQELGRHLELRPIRRLPSDHRRHPYDAIVYHMGNSPAHTSIWETLRQLPGVVVLHDFVLHHFMLGYAATVRHDVASYQAEAARRYGAEGQRVANLMARGRFTDAAFDLPFCEDVLAAASGLIAHSHYALDRARVLRPDLPSAYVPMGVPLPPLISRDEARARRGLPADALILASFGHINPYKRIDAVLRALRALRREGRPVHYLLVGSVSPNYDPRSAIARAGLDDAVTITGYVDRAAFEDYVAATDICLNLRHPTAGETSASLLRLLGAARPTLVTASGSFVELPPGVAAQVDADASEGDLILAYCRLLAARPDLAAALGANAREYVAREHTLDGAALGYIRFLAAHYGWGGIPTPRERPLWTLAPAASVEPQQQPFPPPAPQPPVVRAESITAAVGAALAELGATEEDAALLEHTARAIAELNSAPCSDPA